MTIKALHGGKLLCLMAAVAGAMTLGSCKDDDNDDPEPEPAPVVPVDTTPKKVVYPDQFYTRFSKRHNQGKHIACRRNQLRQHQR